MLGVDWICLVGVCERGEEETGLLITGCGLVGGRVDCIRAKGRSWLHGPSFCTMGATVGVDVWIYISISELKLSAPSSWGMF